MLTVVISQGQSRSPEKRELEQQIAQVAAALPETAVKVVPHLYDLTAQSESVTQLRQIPGPMVVLGWMYPRGLRWVLDRNGIRGSAGEVLLTDANDDEEEESPETRLDESKPRVIDDRPAPTRSIYCIDLKSASEIGRFAEELKRIADKHQSRTEEFQLFGIGSVQSIQDHPGRRWYPVIDYSRCTNCMECIDFCLFGVYGVDGVETILVEQPDNCRKGCPACSRVCPENAIIFPQHKTPAIAGAPVELAGLKIDLSKLFGAPDTGEDAVEAAVRERDEQLILAGRQAVGTEVGLRTASADRPKAPKDDFDRLLDQLDSLDL